MAGRPLWRHRSQTSRCGSPDLSAFHRSRHRRRRRLNPIRNQPVEWMPNNGKTRDIQILEGCWALDSHYRTRDVNTGAISTVASWNMCFDANGVGNQTLQFDTGTTCRSGTTARFNSVGQLEIRDDANVHCSDQSYIYKRVMTCDHQSDGTASCQSNQPELGGSLTQVRIRSR